MHQVTDHLTTIKLALTLVERRAPLPPRDRVALELAVNAADQLAVKLAKRETTAPGQALGS